jgi:hypothetical protein
VKELETQLIAEITAHETELHDLWVRRISETTTFGQLMRLYPAFDPVRDSLRDLRRVLEGKLPASNIWPGATEPPQIGPQGVWRIGLCQGIEVVLMGETVLRHWARTHLRAGDTEFLDLFETLNRATHKLVRFYALRYCENCRASLAGSEEAQSIEEPKAKR